MAGPRRSAIGPRTHDDPGRRTTCLLLALFVLVLAAAVPARVAAQVTATCTTPAFTLSCSGWFTSDVVVHWGVTECPDQPITADTSGATVSCTSNDENGSPITVQVVIKRDATPPEVTAAVPDRPPDYRGWYTAPVTFGFIGADATSGLAACAPATYAGPDSASAAIVGTCADDAGNASSRMFGLRFDATPPPVVGLHAAPGDRRVEIRWSTDPDATLVEVLRVPGVGTNAASVVFQGPGSSFLDANVANGVTYVYRVRLGDAAGNESTDAISATPRLPSADPPPGTGPLVPGPRPRGAHLRFPRANAVISASRPPILRWTRVRRARYYNVQLHRGGRKVLSAWPARPRYRLQRRWSYNGKLRRLTPGRYVWYVWPGYGRRSAARYGDLIGRRTFRVGQAR